MMVHHPSYHRRRVRFTNPGLAKSVLDQIVDRVHSTVLRSSETGGYNDMQCTLFGHDGGVLRRLPSRFGVGEVVAIVSV